MTRRQLRQLAAEALVYFFGPPRGHVPASLRLAHQHGCPASDRLAASDEAVCDCRPDLTIRSGDRTAIVRDLKAFAFDETVLVERTR